MIDQIDQLVNERAGPMNENDNVTAGCTVDMELPSLDALGLKFGTDKSSAGHDYLSFYETFLEPLRHEEVRILEVGVAGGASLRMWQQYFTRATIIGVDIHPGVVTFAGGRIRTEIIDQSNLQDLVGLGIRHGPFDVIVDDGSHKWSHQIETLRTLFPFLTPRGIFIMEDLHTNYGTLSAAYRGASSISCMDYLKRLVDRRVASEQLQAATEEDAFLQTYATRVRFVSFLKHACVIGKDDRVGSTAPFIPGDTAPEIASKPLLRRSREQPERAITIACHIDWIGDVHSHTGSLQSLDRDIQGFILYSTLFPAGSLEYRALCANGRWTEWVRAGSFAGTMGMSQALRGFSVRLVGDVVSDLTLELIGLFRGHEGPVRVAAEEDCVPSSGSGALHGMQINLITR